MYDFTVTQVGKVYLKEIFQKPSINTSEIYERQRNVECLYEIMNKNGKPFQSELRRCFTHYTWFARRIVSYAAQNGGLNARIWGQLKENCKTIVKIDAVFEKYSVKLPCSLINDLQSVNRVALKDAFELIDKCIEPEGD